MCYVFFSYRKKKHIPDTTYNKKTRAFARLYKEEAIKIYFNENKTIKTIISNFQLKLIQRS